MNLRQIFFRPFFCLLLASGLAGCGGTDPAGSHQIIASNSGLADGANAFELLKRQREWESGDVRAKAQTLWAEVQQVYAKMDRYSDQAQVQLRYELLGNVMFEAMPVSVSYDRKSGAWESQLFRALLFGDPNNIVMTVKEAATNHLDRQVKLMSSGKGVRQLADSDPVARIYLSGATDIPLSEPGIANLVLFAPQLEWLVGDQRQNPQSTTADTEAKPVDQDNLKKCNYLGWTIYNDSVCVKLSRMSHGFETEYWIDLEQKLVRKMVFSNSVLHSELAETPEVRGLRLHVDFGEIAWGPDARAPSGYTNFPVDRTVQRLVKIPEAFPSPWIGRVSPIVTLKSHDNSSVRLPANQRPTLGLFMSQLEVNAAWWQVLERTAAASELSTTTVALVLDGIDTQPMTTNVAHRPLGNIGPYLVSHGAEAWQTLGLNQGQWLVIWDANGVVQYVGPAEMDRLNDTAVKVLQRLQRGEAIGEEMIREYQTFYTDYLTQLEAQRVTDLPAGVGTTASKSPPSNRSIPDNP